MELLAVGDLWVFLLIFPATNTTSDEARLSLVHVGELVPCPGPLCRQGAFLCRKHSPLFFLLLPFLSKKPASMTMFWSCVPPQICDSDFATALLSYTNFQFYLFIAQALCGTYHCLGSLNTLWFMAFSNMYFPFICTASFCI